MLSDIKFILIIPFEVLYSDGVVWLGEFSL